MIFEACDAGVQEQGRDLDPTRNQPGNEFGREWTRRRWHLGASGFGGENRLIHRGRPRTRDVVVANRTAKSFEIRQHGFRELERCQPKSGASVDGSGKWIWREKENAAVLLQLQHHAGVSVTIRERRDRAYTAYFNDPEISRQP